MKTSSNISRTKSGMITILMTISLLTIDLSAQQNYTEYSFKNADHYIYLSAKSNILGSVPHIYINTSAIDLPLEDWMFNPMSWNLKSETKMVPSIFLEENLEIESWMTKPDWNKFDEEEMRIEKWMTTPETWVSR